MIEKNFIMISSSFQSSAKTNDLYYNNNFTTYFNLRNDIYNILKMYYSRLLKRDF